MFKQFKLQSEYFNRITFKFDKNFNKSENFKLCCQQNPNKLQF